MEPVQASDLVRDVLARDERLVDILARHGRHFEQLRDPKARRTMGALVTVEQAARTAGVSPSVLVDDLNSALGMAGGGATATGRGSMAAESGANAVAARTPDADAPPHWPTNAPVTELDVREDLRNGQEPFSRITAAVGSLPAGNVLLLRTTFEPAPLYAVLARRGFVHASEQIGDDDWCVRFWQPVEAHDAAAADTPDPRSSPQDAAATAASAAPLSSAPPDATVHWLDVRGLEPPEPMVRTLAMLESLPEGHTLVQVNARAPQFLLPILTERGFAFSIDDSDSDRVLVRIHRGP
ncbi:MAG TPA: DUF2249 domain-containing protein [Gemmatimonadaceae bacterium]|nr:DUF2249 domain-containing protein [Gemmatimonadaceae bacterium]